MSLKGVHWHSLVENDYLEACFYLIFGHLPLSSSSLFFSFYSLFVFPSSISPPFLLLPPLLSIPIPFFSLLLSFSLSPHLPSSNFFPSSAFFPFPLPSLHLPTPTLLGISPYSPLLTPFFFYLFPLAFSFPLSHLLPSSLTYLYLLLLSAIFRQRHSPPCPSLTFVLPPGEQRFPDGWSREINYIR